MRIYDPKSKRVLTEMTLFLTPQEAKKLGQSALDLARNPRQNHHHVSDENFEREITVTVHTPENLAEFDPEARKLIGT